MGGNALSVPTRRYSKDEYFQLQKEITHELWFIYQSVLTIPSYKNKDSFGDLDLIVNKPKYDNLNYFLEWDLGSKQIVTNGEVVSFEYKEFQVDLIHIDPTKLHIARTYFSYNDLGVLMGVLAKRLNCKYGHEGLFYTYYNHDRSYKKDIFLSDEPPVIFNFLDLSYFKFLDGFNDLEDIFKYVTTSKYFDTKAFINEEEWNHIRRTRNRKRLNWNKFINYLTTNNIQISNPKIEGVKYYVADYFSKVNLLEQLDELDHEQVTKSIIKTKFNGEIVSRLTGLTGKELGAFISSYKKDKTDFTGYIVRTEIVDIEQDITEFWLNRQNNYGN